MVCTLMQKARVMHQSNSLLMNFLKDKGIKRAIIRISPSNESSLKIPYRLGFDKKGTIETKQEENLVSIYVRIYCEQ